MAAQLVRWRPASQAVGPRQALALEGVAFRVRLVAAGASRLREQDARVGRPEAEGLVADDLRGGSCYAAGMGDGIGPAHPEGT